MNYAQEVQKRHAAAAEGQNSRCKHRTQAHAGDKAEDKPKHAEVLGASAIQTEHRQRQHNEPVPIDTGGRSRRAAPEHGTRLFFYCRSK